MVLIAGLRQRGGRLLPTRERRFIWMLSAFLLLFLAMPLAEDCKFGGYLENVLFMVVLLLGLRTIQESRHFKTALILAAAFIVANTVNFFLDSPLLVLCDCVLSIAVILITIVELIKHLAGKREVVLDSVLGGLCVYLLIGIFWYTVYAALTLLNPQAFSYSIHTAPAGPASVARLLFYFSYITLLTMGYGDIVPVSPMAQSLVVIEGILGQFYLVYFMARLVSLQIAHNKDEKEGV